MSTAMLLLHIGLPALAFAPDADVHIGKDPSRVVRALPARQAQLAAGADWRSFTDGIGVGWTARFDDWSGLPRWARGPGIPVDASSPEAVAASISAILRDHPGLVGGLDLDEALALRDAHYVADRDAWIVDFDQLAPGSVFPQDQPQRLAPSVLDFEHFAAHGQPVVWRGGVQAHVKNGKLVALSVKVLPEWSGTRQLSAAEAVEVATTTGPTAGLDHAVQGAALAVVPQSDIGAPQARLAWMVRSSTGGVAPGKWVSFVDAENGRLINVHNQVRYLDGVLSAQHDTRTVDGNMSVSPVVDLVIEDELGNSTTTDRSGAYSLDGSEATAAFYDGTYFDVRDNGRTGSSGMLAWTESDPVWTDDDATQAEIDVYVFLTMVQEWAEVYAADTGIVEDGMRANVNLSSTCNAYYDGSSVNFYVAGSGCNNTGRIKDVAFHEWGHGLHYYAARTGYVDGSIGEGSADVVAILETDDSVMAPYFQTNGSGIRDVGPDRSYPEDYVNSGDYVHSNGLIFGGSAWDYLKLLEAELGYDAAKAIVSEQLVDVLQTNPEIADTYDAWMLIDDDDGDLSNGTPHDCAIIEAFGRHGLGPAGSGESFLLLSHSPIEEALASAPGYDLEALVQNPAPDCLDNAATGASVHYSVDGGDTWETAPLELDGEEVSGQIPAQPAGTVIEYYVEVESSAGSSFAPEGGFITPLSFVVGELEEIACFDFESDDGGFWSELVSGTETLGADDWMWGEPGGYADDPLAAYSGNMVWANDLGGRIDGEDWNGAYQDDKHNRLNSPEISLEGYENVVLQYRRWLQVEDGYFDQANILANGEQVWTNHASDRSRGEEHHLDWDWALHTVALPEAGSVVLSWEIVSDGGLGFGGWTIDDVCVYGVSAGSDDGGDEGGDDGSGDDGSGDDGTETDNPESDDEPTVSAGDTSVSGSGGKDDVSACSTASSAPRSGWLAMAGLLGLGLVFRRRD